MCLILFGYRTDPATPLIVAANRDEAHDRASSAAEFWNDFPSVLAGRDLVAGGTWLGCTRQGRFAAITNFSNPDDAPGKLSRGLLVQKFLTSTDTAQHYAQHLAGLDYCGFNLLLFDGNELVCTSNRGSTDVLSPGYYGLSNAELGAQWPKCVQGAQALKTITRQDFADEELVALLGNSAVPPDDLLPHRGRPIETERRVAPCFIVGEEYGTRASTVVVIQNDNIRFSEQTYFSAGEVGGLVEFEFAVE